MAGGYRLGITCPECGGKLEIDEASRATKCSHCASVLKISRSGAVPKYYLESHFEPREVKFLVERHLKKAGYSLVSSWHSLTQVYLPFWRVRGTVFKIECPNHEAYVDIPGHDPFGAGEDEGIEVKITPREVSFCAEEKHLWGLTSLGVRAQVLKLSPVDKEFQEANYRVAPMLSDKQAEQRFTKAADSVAHLKMMGFSHLQMHIVGLDKSLIYFPIWLVDFSSAEGRQLAQFDAIAKRVVDISEHRFEPPPPEPVSTEQAAVQITAHRCPNCGADLPVADSVTFYCGNCWRLYADDGNSYRQLKVQVPEGTSEGAQLFPFWVFDLTSSEWSEKSLFLETLRQCSLQQNRLIMPAFDISNPARIMRLMRHFNHQEHKIKFDPSRERHFNFVDVHYTPDAVAEMVVPLLKGLQAKRSQMVVKGELKKTPKLTPPELIWLPFVPDRYFLRDEITGATIEKAAVRV